MTSEILAELGRQALISLIQQQGERIAELSDEAKELKKANEHLCEKLGASERVSHRQAAPHRIATDKRKTAPEKPGRKEGHQANWRAKPAYVDPRMNGPLKASALRVSSAN